jgi:dephospho-CoA kinase
MRLFPQRVRAGKISRKKLGALVFQDSAKRKKLEAVLHPLVWRARQKKIALAKKKGIDIVVLEIPLLFETGEDKKCDKTLCVSATQKTQKERVFRRPQMTEKKWKAIWLFR